MACVSTDLDRALSYALQRLGTPNHIRLMEDQVASLRKRVVNAAIVTSGGGVSNEFCAIDDDLVTTQTSFAPSHL